MFRETSWCGMWTVRLESDGWGLSENEGSLGILGGYIEYVAIRRWLLLKIFVAW